MCIDLKTEGTCPFTHDIAVLRAVDELLSNALEHGFYARQRGRVLVHVVGGAATGVQITVGDDGWGFGAGAIIDGNGFHLLRQIGELSLGRPSGVLWARTVVTVRIPLHRPDRSSALPRAVELRTLRALGLAGATDETRLLEVRSHMASFHSLQ
ncbi:MAG: hypothetical protein J0I21_08780 [Alphaproteobacteria bacterium]|nr:hypothetical protein [Alphaproteobacteria bacterium]